MKILFLTFVLATALALASAGVYFKDYILVVIAVVVCIYLFRRSIRSSD
jgi:hypothetical protein